MPPIATIKTERSEALSVNSRALQMSLETFSGTVRGHAEDTDTILARATAFKDFLSKL